MPELTSHVYPGQGNEEWQHLCHMFAIPELDDLQVLFQLYLTLILIMKIVKGEGWKKERKDQCFSNTGSSCIQQSQNWSLHTHSPALPRERRCNASGLRPAQPVRRPIRARGSGRVSVVWRGLGCRTPVSKQIRLAERRRLGAHSLAWPLVHPKPWANYTSSISLSFLTLENLHRTVIVISLVVHQSPLTRAHSKWANKGPPLPSSPPLSSSSWSHICPPQRHHIGLSRERTSRKGFKNERLISFSCV